MYVYVSCSLVGHVLLVGVSSFLLFVLNCRIAVVVLCYMFVFPPFSVLYLYSYVLCHADVVFWYSF